VRISDWSSDVCSSDLTCISCPVHRTGRVRKPGSGCSGSTSWEIPMADVQHRVKFDFEIEFTNGGSLHGKDFRLDIPGDAISDAALVDHVVADMRLLMAGPTRLRNKRLNQLGKACRR